MTETSLYKEVGQTDFERMKALALEDLFFFTRGILGNDEMTESLHLPFCRFLQGRSLRKLACMARGFFKTTVGTKGKAIWHSCRNPYIAQLIACQAQSNASKIVDDIRNQWDRNTTLQAFFPELLPSRDNRWSGEQACLTRPKEGFHQQENTYEAAGIGTQLQSRHFDKIFADDLVVAKKDQTTGEWMRPSEEDIQKAIGWHQMVYGLMRKVATCEYTQIMTRWCPDDLYDYFEKEEPDRWDIFLKPAIENGEPTFPEKYPSEVLEDIRHDQGPYKFTTQYLCNPTDPEQLLFLGLYNVYTRRDQPSGPWKRLEAAIDPGVGMKKGNCPSGLLCVGMKEDGRRYVLHAQSKRMTGSEQVEACFALWRRLHFRTLYVEAIAYQEVLAQAIKERFAKTGERLFRVVPVKYGRGQSKEARIEGLQPSFANGWWYIRADQIEMMDELDKYPMGHFVDLLDALATINRRLPRQQGVNEEKDLTPSRKQTIVTYEDMMRRVTARGSHGSGQAAHYPKQLAETVFRPEPASIVGGW